MRQKREKKNNGLTKKKKKKERKTRKKKWRVVSVERKEKRLTQSLSYCLCGTPGLIDSRRAGYRSAESHTRVARFLQPGRTHTQSCMLQWGLSIWALCDQISISQISKDLLSRAYERYLLSTYRGVLWR